MEALKIAALSRLRSLLARANHHDEYSPSILSCMNHISMGLFMHLSDECYGWKENEGVKRFECLILSRFLIDYALLTTKDFSREKRQFYLNLTDVIFEEAMKTEFPWLKVPDIVKAKLSTYSNIMLDTLPPTRWQLLAGACTEIDYSSELDEPTLIASSSVFPALLRFAQNLWEQVM
jgi:hypothetical protein